MTDVLEQSATSTPPEPKSADVPPTPPAPADDGESYAARHYARRANAKPVDKPHDKPTDATPDAAATTEEKPKPVAKAKTPKPAPVVVPPPDYGAMEDRIAAGVARGIQPLVAKPAPVTDRTAGLSYTVRRDYDVLKRLEKEGKVRAGRSDLYLDQLERQVKREDEWLMSNPEGEYDPHSEENKAFTKANSLEDVDEEDFEAAQEELREERIAQRLKKDFEPELQPLKQANWLRAEAPKITAARVRAAQTFFEHMGEEFTKHLQPDGRMLLSEVDKLVNADPANLPAITAAHKVAIFAEQIHRLARQDPLPPLEKPDDENAPYISEGEVVNEVTKFEKAYKSLPPNLSEEEGGSMDNQGRMFATVAEYNAMTESQQTRYWRFDPPKIVNTYAQVQAELVKRTKLMRETELETFAKAKGYVKNGGEVPATTPEAKPRPSSPPGTIAPNAAPEMTRSVKPNGSENSGWLSSVYDRK